MSRSAGFGGSLEVGLTLELAQWGVTALFAKKNVEKCSVLKNSQNITSMHLIKLLRRSKSQSYAINERSLTSAHLKRQSRCFAVHIAHLSHTRFVQRHQLQRCKHRLASTIGSICFQETAELINIPSRALFRATVYTYFPLFLLLLGIFPTKK